MMVNTKGGWDAEERVGWVHSHKEQSRLNRTNALLDNLDSLGLHFLIYKSGGVTYDRLHWQGRGEAQVTNKGVPSVSNSERQQRLWAEAGRLGSNPSSSSPQPSNRGAASLREGSGQSLSLRGRLWASWQRTCTERAQRRRQEQSPHRRWLHLMALSRAAVLETGSHANKHQACDLEAQ